MMRTVSSLLLAAAIAAVAACGGNTPPAPGNQPAATALDLPARVTDDTGAEPLDAYRMWLQESASRGDFRIIDKGLEAGFWRYYRDDSIHDFFKPGSAEEAKACADPPWLTD